MPNTFYFLLILILGGGIRILSLSSLPFDSDQAIVGLMGKHILEGAFPWLYYGDSYSGILEPILTSWIFLGLKINRLALHLTPLLFSLLFLISIYQLGRELYNRQIGLLSMFLAAIPPFYFGLYSTMAYGGYIETLWLGNLILLITYRLGVQKAPLAQIPLFMLGILWGITWWTYPIGVMYLITSGLFISFQKKEFVLKGRGAISCLGFIGGSLPFWIWNGTHQFPFLKFTRSPVSPNPTEKVHLFLANLREMFTLPYKKELNSVIPSYGLILWAGLIVLILFLMGILFLILRKKEIKGYPQKDPGGFLLFSFFTVFTLVYMGTRFIESSDALRYILPLYSLFPITLALIALALKGKSRIIGYLILLFLCSFGGYHNLVLFLFNQLSDARYKQQLQVDDHLLTFLRTMRAAYAYTPEYWSAAALTFNALENPVFTLPFKDRYPLNTLRADASSAPVFVLEGKYRQSFEEMIKATKGSFKKEEIAPFPKFKNYFVYYDFKAPRVEVQEILPDHWKGSSNVNQRRSDQAFDRDVSTCWTTVHPQTTGMYYQLDLGESYYINHIVLTPGRETVWDFPCFYRIDLSLNGTDWSEVSSVKNNWAYLLWSRGRPFWKLRDGRLENSFNPQKARFIRITLTADAPNPWAIGEIFLYQIAAETIKADLPSLEEILAFLDREKIECLYADMGLSAQITQVTRGRIKCLLEDYDITRGRDYALWGYNGAFPYRNPLKKAVDFSLHPAFVICKENNQAFVRVAGKNFRSYQNKRLGPYLIYYRLELEESLSQDLKKGARPFYWNGTHLLKSGSRNGDRDER